MIEQLNILIQIYNISSPSNWYEWKNNYGANGSFVFLRLSQPH